MANNRKVIPLPVLWTDTATQPCHALFDILVRIGYIIFRSGKTAFLFGMSIYGQEKEDN